MVLLSKISKGETGEVIYNNKLIWEKLNCSISIEYPISDVCIRMGVTRSEVLG